MSIKEQKEEISEIVDGKLYISNLSTSKNHEVLKKYQIGVVVTVMRKPLSDNEKMENVEYIHFQLSDHPYSKIEKFFGKFEDIMCSNNKVLVHCRMGISRSPSIVMSYLITQKKEERNSTSTIPEISVFEECLNFLLSKRPCVNVNPGFEIKLKKFSSETLLKSFLMMTKKKKKKVEQKMSNEEKIVVNVAVIPMDKWKKMYKDVASYRNISSFDFKTSNGFFIGTSSDEKFVRIFTCAHLLMPDVKTDELILERLERRIKSPRNYDIPLFRDIEIMSDYDMNTSEESTGVMSSDDDSENSIKDKSFDSIYSSSINKIDDDNNKKEQQKQLQEEEEEEEEEGEEEKDDDVGSKPSSSTYRTSKCSFDLREKMLNIFGTTLHRKPKVISFRKEEYYLKLKDQAFVVVTFHKNRNKKVFDLENDVSHFLIEIFQRFLSNNDIQILEDVDSDHESSFENVWRNKFQENEFSINFKDYFVIGIKPSKKNEINYILKSDLDLLIIDFPTTENFLNYSTKKLPKVSLKQKIEGLLKRNEKFNARGKLDNEIKKLGILLKRYGDLSIFEEEKEKVREYISTMILFLEMICNKGISAIEFNFEKTVFSLKPDFYSAIMDKYIEFKKETLIMKREIMDNFCLLKKVFGKKEDCSKLMIKDELSSRKEIVDFLLVLLFGEGKKKKKKKKKEKIFYPEKQCNLLFERHIRIEIEMIDWWMGNIDDSRRGFVKYLRKKYNYGLSSLAINRGKVHWNYKVLNPTPEFKRIDVVLGYGFSGSPVFLDIDNEEKEEGVVTVSGMISFRVNDRINLRECLSGMLYLGDPKVVKELKKLK